MKSFGLTVEIKLWEISDGSFLFSENLLTSLHSSIHRCLTKNSNAEVVIHTFKPVCVELYKDYKDLGRFMLRYGGETIAAGVVTEVSC